MENNEEFERYYSKKYGVCINLIRDARLPYYGYTETTRLGKNLNIASSAWWAAIKSLTDNTKNEAKS